MPFSLFRSAQVRTDIQKSPNDDREYAHITLENGLEVLVVSEPDADKAGAAMCVDVGYWRDPEGLPGLAHFLEHMLFLGTEKYPEEAEYGNFITANNGLQNAYTSDIYTNYQFEGTSLIEFSYRFHIIFFLVGGDQSPQQTFYNKRWLCS